MPNKTLTLSKQFFKKFQDDEIATRSASLAFYSTFAIAPLLLLLVSWLSLMNINVETELLNEVREIVGSNASQVLESIIKGAKSRRDLGSISGWVGVGLLLFSASIIFSELQKTFNKIFLSKEQELTNPTWQESVKEFIHKRLLSVAMVLSFIIITTISLVLSASISYLFKDQTKNMVSLLNTVFSFLVYTTLFTSMYKLLTDHKIKIKNAFLGGAITSILFLIGRFLIGVYISKSSFSSVYGSAGSFVILLSWVYYSALIIFVGAEVSFFSVLSEKNQQKK